MTDERSASASAAPAPPVDGPVGAQRSLVVQHWVVAFLDLLGQRDALRKMDFLPEQDDPARTAALVEAVRGSVGVINHFHRLLDELQATKSEEGDGACAGTMPPEARAIYTAFRSTRISRARLSDGLMVFFPTVPSPGHSPVQACYELVCTAGTMMLASLAWGHPIRGGIDIGTGVEVDQDQLHGPAVVKAYEIESQVAQCPRVVVGAAFAKFLQDVAGMQGGIEAQLHANCARATQSLLRQDGDGQIIVDYLGDKFRQFVSQTEDQALVHRARGFVETELQRFTALGCEKLKARYERLLAYFDSRSHVWV